MSKSAAALQRALEPKTQAVAAPARPSLAPVANVQPGRVGKVQIAAYLSQDYKKSLRLIQTNEDKSIQALLAEALNMLFEKHNVPTVAGE
jgi:hypothetical protein